MTEADEKPPINMTSPDMPSEDKAKDELVNSYAVAKRLLPFLAKRGIPALPKNYRIFYDYLLYTNPALNKAVNGLLDSNAQFNSKLSSSLYDHFYSHEVLDTKALAISQAALDFIAVSNTMEQHIETAMTQASHYHQVLSTTSRQMGEHPSLDELQSFLDELLLETETSLAVGGHFSSQLQEANQTIAALKDEIKNQTTLAKIDELTKLYNRRHLNFEAPLLMAQAAKTGRPLAAIMFDIDKFKLINDNWGHNFGDKVLVICAEIIQKAARSTDVAVRLGGEEFLLLAGGLDAAGAARVAERIRQTLVNTEITVRGQALPVTISGGVAQYRPGENLTALLARADTALYQAKNGGRNQIRVAEEETPDQAAPATDQLITPQGE
ncbi:MAG: GGDEF domain-containing protein [Candidatus Adiutrix sp.]|jgi:diguanylate cyclase|nr:GGDEF domain-containing protein [Candidatus Adiutrix sp.]